jgi:diguanylate cyclase (GGDEF)-like protein
MGGDEFTVLAFECSESGYEQMVKRIDLAVAEYNKTSGNPWKLGYSSGFASSEQEHGFDIDNLLRLADQALYKVKLAKKSRQSCENTIV